VSNPPMRNVYWEKTHNDTFQDFRKFANYLPLLKT
jgi:hypothetical protein